MGLGAAYLGLKDISRATPFLQQALAIAQETKNRQLEEAAQKLLSLAQLQNTPLPMVSTGCAHCLLDDSVLQESSAEPR